MHPKCTLYVMINKLLSSIIEAFLLDTLCYMNVFVISIAIYLLFFSEFTSLISPEICIKSNIFRFCGALFLEGVHVKFFTRGQAIG